MPGKCFVPDCNYGLESVRRRCKKENKKHPKIFSAPKSWTMLQIWSHVIPRTDKKFSITDKICELHFPEDYISKFHEISLKDGEVLRLERNHARLKPGAVPTVFSNLPHYSENVEKIINEMREEFPLHVPEMEIQIDEQMKSYFKRIKEVQTMSLSNSKIAIHEVEKSKYTEDINLNLNVDEANLCSDDLDLSTEDRNIASQLDFSVSDEDIDMTTESKMSEHKEIDTGEENESEPDEITFDVLVQSLKSVPKPNSSWSVTSHGKFVMCAKWNKEYQPEKRVVIDRDLNIKVFLNDNEIAAYNNLCITEISDISNILRILDK